MEGDTPKAAQWQTNLGGLLKQPTLYMGETSKLGNSLFTCFHIFSDISATSNKNCNLGSSSELTTPLSSSLNLTSALAAFITNFPEFGNDHNKIYLTFTRFCIYQWVTFKSCQCLITEYYKASFYFLVFNWGWRNGNCI